MNHALPTILLAASSSCGSPPPAPVPLSRTVAAVPASEPATPSLLGVSPRPARPSAPVHAHLPAPPQAPTQAPPLARSEALEPAARPARPLTPADALYVVSEIAGAIVPVRDANADGFGDLVVARGHERGAVRSFDLISSKDGSGIRRLYACDAPDRPAPFAWDAGGDIDGDGTADLLLGFPDDASGAGRVLAISGASAKTVLDLRGSEPDERFGTSLAFLGDVDRDGRDDFVVAAVQANPQFPVYGRRILRYESTTSGDITTRRIQFEDGTWVDEDAYVRERLSSRSLAPGFVSLRSGSGGAELWRAHGTNDGHAFGTSMRAVGDLDGDRVLDLAAGCDARSLLAPTLLSGASGRPIARLDPKSGPVGGVGDVDRDGIPDLYVDTLDSYRTSKMGHVRILSGRTRAQLFQLPYPDWWSEYGTTTGVGDLDGDGHADVALGDGNFNLLAERNPGGTPGCEVDVTKLTLDQAIALESQPWCSFTWESGCAVVYSGRTRKAIFGVWAPPGSRQGLGLEVAALPDVNGDGAPDLIVADGSSAFAFAGPGRRQ